MSDGEPVVVHRDEHLLVLFKPARLPTTHPSGGDCLVERAKTMDPGAPRLHATSRLDAEVTGLVTFARTRAANAALRAARAAKAYHRLYLALATEPLDGPGRWDAPIAIDPSDPRRRVAEDRSGAKASLTLAAPRAAAGPLALLELRPQTGRTHQLRVHAAHAGIPLFGDVRYGGAKRAVLPNGLVLTARRTMLHCAALDLPSVEGGVSLALRCPPPKDFAQLWLRAGGEHAALEPGSAQPK